MSAISAGLQHSRTLSISIFLKFRNSNLLLGKSKTALYMKTICDNSEMILPFSGKTTFLPNQTKSFTILLAIKKRMSTEMNQKTN